MIFLGCGVITGSTSSKERHHGFVAGAGVEYMIAPNVIFGVEYSYTDLGAETHTGAGSIGVVGLGSISGETKTRVDPDAIHAISARLSFKFGGSD